MKKLLMILSIVASIFATTACVKSGKDGDKENMRAKMVDVEQGLPAKSLKSASGLPMVVDFSATWCPPCQKLRPEFERFKKEFAGGVDMLTIDIDAHPEIADEYDVQAVPTLVFLAPDGRELSRSVGYVEPEELHAMIQELMGDEH